MGDNKKEIRNTTGEVITEVESRTVEGYAILYNRSSDGLSFEEVILPGSLDGVVQRSDVFALLNHDQNRGILARAKNGQGSLELCVDAKGLKYRFEAPKTALGDELLENLRRGEINESSFCFVVGEDKWEKKEDGTWKRTISKIDELFDVSPVYNAAYSQTTAYTRGRDTAQEELDKADKGDKPDAAYYESLLID